MRCRLCRKPADEIYAVDRDKQIPLCGRCAGRHSPRELDRLLGVKQKDYGSEGLTTKDPKV